VGIGYIVLASCHSNSFYHRFQACLTVYSHWASQVTFRKDRTIREEHLLKMLKTVSNHKSSRYPPCIAVQIFQNTRNIAIRLTFRTTRLKVITDSPRDIRFETLINCTDRPAANTRTKNSKY